MLPAISLCLTVTEHMSRSLLTPHSSAAPQMPGSAPYTAASFHPDGLLLVTGTSDAKAQIWEMRQQKAVTGFEAGG